MKNILLVDDDIGFCDSIVSLLDPEGYSVATLNDSFGAIDFIHKNVPDVVLLDVQLAESNGIDLLKEINQIQNAPPVIIISAFVNAENAIQAMTEGAFEYITKPFKVDKLMRTISKATGSGVISQNTVEIIKESNDDGRGGSSKALPVEKRYNEIIGKSDEIVEIAKMIGQVARSDAAVLIFGESGTGKELVARAIHRNSNRNDNVFLSVNCAALTESLLESELFGHEKGSFTSAIARKLGKFELADKGTLFLDEIADTSLTTQSKLLRVLQEKEFQRVGGEETHKVDVRIIAATNKSLVSAIKEKAFRIDLFYRLKVISIYMPSLRDRTDDIPLLADHFTQRYNNATGKNVQGISQDAMRLMMKYTWPGNVRELENNIHTAVVMTKNRYLQVDDLPISKETENSVKINFEELIDDYYKTFQAVLDPVFNKVFDNSNGHIYQHIQEASEKAIIGMTLHRLNNNQVKAAEALGISRNTLRDRIDRYKI